MNMNMKETTPRVVRFSAPLLTTSIALILAATLPCPAMLVVVRLMLVELAAD